MIRRAFASSMTRGPFPRRPLPLLGWYVGHTGALPHRLRLEAPEQVMKRAQTIRSGCSRALAAPEDTPGPLPGASAHSACVLLQIFEVSKSTARGEQFAHPVYQFPPTSISSHACSRVSSVLSWVANSSHELGGLSGAALRRP